MNCKAVIHKLYFPLDGCLNYDVQLWYEYRKGCYAYAGNGKYFRTAEEAEAYALKKSTVSIEKNY